MPKRPYSDKERERQKLRQKFQRLYARCLRYGISPWEFYYYTQLKEAAAELAKMKAQKKINKNYPLRDYIEKHFPEDAYRSSLISILDKMGKVTGDPIASGFRRDPRMRLDTILALAHRRKAKP